MTRLKLLKKRNPPTHPKKILAWKIMNNRHFDAFIACCITLSTILMSLRYYTMTFKYQTNIEIGSGALTLVYNLEAVIKIMALEQEYFQDSWNRFDLFIVLTSDCAIIMDLFAKFYPVLRVYSLIINTIRILRVFRLIRVSEQLRILIDSLIVILPSISNVLSLIGLMFFIFSVIGMNMFSRVKYQKEIN